MTDTTGKPLSEWAEDYSFGIDTRCEGFSAYEREEVLQFKASVVDKAEELEARCAELEQTNKVLNVRLDKAHEALSTEGPFETVDELLDALNKPDPELLEMRELWLDAVVQIEAFKKVIKNGDGYETIKQLRRQLTEKEAEIERLIHHCAAVGVAAVEDNTDAANESWRSLPDDLQDRINAETEKLGFEP